MKPGKALLSPWALWQMGGAVGFRGASASQMGGACAKALGPGGQALEALRGLAPEAAAVSPPEQLGLPLAQRDAASSGTVSSGSRDVPRRACPRARCAGGPRRPRGRARGAGSLPDSATLEMCTPCSAAMKPKMEKTTKPAKKLVPLLMRARMMASLGAEGWRALVRLPAAHGRGGGAGVGGAPTCNSCC